MSVYYLLRRITPVLAKTALFIFLASALQPDFSEGAMQTWLTHAEGGPRFGKQLMATRQSVSAVGLLIGVVIYNKFLTTVPYRRIFLMAQVALLLAGILDYILVIRWNLIIGVPDIAFVMGDEAFQWLCQRFFMMPLFVLSAKVCPDNLEATLFAMLMALSNLGSDVGSTSGAVLTDLLGIKDNNFDRMPQAVIIKSCCRILPIPFIFLLVPKLTPQDPVPGGDGSTCEHGQPDPESRPAVTS